jgi:DNA-binding NarL/FixJ family response regulator
VTVDQQLRVVVVDDHQMFRDGLATLLDALAEVEVVGRASSGEEAVELAASTAPDVMLMDLHMPGIGGVEATRRITAAQPAIAVIALTMLDDDRSVRAAVAAGARGYLLKEATVDQVLGALRAVAAGNVIFGGAITRQVLAAVADPTSTRRLAGLTEREEEVLDLLARGLTNAAIASRLSLSGKTVRNYVSNLFTKLGVTDRAAAVAAARDAGYGTKG